MSRKIKSVSVLTEDGLQPLTEVKNHRWGDRAKEFVAFGYGKKKTHGFGKNSNVTGDEEDSAGQADRVKIQETNRERVIKSVFSVESSRKRVLVWVSDGDLRNEYLVGSGAEKLVNGMSDRQIDAMFFDAQAGHEHKAADQFMDVIDGQFNLDDVLAYKHRGGDGQRAYCILLNVPANLFNTQVRNIQEARKLMVQILSHHNYVGTLDVNEIDHANVGPLTNIKERMQKFSVRKFVEAWVSNFVIAGARKEEEEYETMEDKPEDMEVVKKVVDFAANYAITAITHDDVFSGGANGGENMKTTQFISHLKGLLFDPEDVKNNGRLIMKVKDAFANDPHVVKLAEQEPKFASIVKQLTGVTVKTEGGTEEAPAAAPAPNASAPAAAPAQPNAPRHTGDSGKAPPEAKSAEDFDNRFKNLLGDFFSTRNENPQSAEETYKLSPNQLAQLIASKVVDPYWLKRFIQDLQAHAKNK